MIPNCLSWEHHWANLGNTFLSWQHVLANWWRGGLPNHHPPILHGGGGGIKTVNYNDPNSLVHVPQVLSQKIASAAFGVPAVHDGDSLCSKQTSIVQKRSFLSMFSCVTCLNHFLHARIPDMGKFRATDPPSKSRLEVDVKISIMDATEPTSKTSDVTMASKNLNLFLMDTLQNFLAKTARLADCKW